MFIGLKDNQSQLGRVGLGMLDFSLTSRLSATVAAHQSQVQHHIMLVCWQRMRSLYCFAMQIIRLHLVVSKLSLVSVFFKKKIGHRKYLTTTAPLSKASAKKMKFFLRWFFMIVCAEGELKAWQTDVSTQHCTDFHSGR